MLQRTNAIQLTTNIQVYFQSTYNNNQIFKLSKMLSQQLLHFIDLLMTSKMLKKIKEMCQWMWKSLEIIKRGNQEKFVVKPL